MAEALKLSKSDARRALVRHHFTPAFSQMEVFDRLRSIQFDPIAPVGCNHDLVLQARLKGYRVGDWQKTAYEERLIYDGWDKMASLVPLEGWTIRRPIHDLYRKQWQKKIFDDHKDAVEAVLKEITERGPMQPKDFEFQQRREDWKISWYGPSVTKQTLRALWHTGQIMTAARRRGQHLYDLTERVMPKHILEEPRLSDFESKVEIALDRYRAMGILKPTAAAEVWSYILLYKDRRELIKTLLDKGEIVPIEVDGVAAHATPCFLKLLDQASLEPRVVFVAPLDPFMWDRKMVRHIFDFGYVWEIYTPEAKRRWGYYVLPILYGDRLVARAEFSCRSGQLELRQWHFEGSSDPGPAFWEALEPAVRELMAYCSAEEIMVKDHIERKVQDWFGRKPLIRVKEHNE